MILRDYLLSSVFVIDQMSPSFTDNISITADRMCENNSRLNEDE